MSERLFQAIQRTRVGEFRDSQPLAADTNTSEVALEVPPDPILALGARLREIKAAALENKVRIDQQQNYAECLRLMTKENLTPDEVATITAILDQLDTFVEVASYPEDNSRPKSPEQAALAKLKSVIDELIVTPQVATFGDYVKKVLVPISGELVNAGLSQTTIQSLLKDALESKISFKEGPSSISDTFQTAIAEFYPAVLRALQAQEQKKATPEVGDVGSSQEQLVNAFSQFYNATYQQDTFSRDEDFPRFLKSLEGVLSSVIPMAELEVQIKRIEKKYFSGVNDSVTSVSEVINNGLVQLKQDIESNQFFASTEESDSKSAVAEVEPSVEKNGMTADAGSMSTAVEIKPTPLILSDPIVPGKSARAIVEASFGNQVTTADSAVEMAAESTRQENVPLVKGQSDEVIDNQMGERVELKTENLENEINFQEKLHSLLHKEAFVPLEYVEFVNELRTTVESRYVMVTKSAEKNLQKYSNIYTPSQTEKEALQFFSSLRGRYIPMQPANSEMGILRAEVMNSLNYTDSHTNEADVRKFTQKYSETMIKVLANITKLENLIAVSLTEKKPPISETYRAQLETLRVSGNQLLATLPHDHELYDSFKAMINSDKPLINSGLSDIILKMSLEQNGDRYFIENSTAIMVLRNKIQAAIEYLKTEQEFADFKKRAKNRLDKILPKLTPQSTDSFEVQATKGVVSDTVARIRADILRPVTLGSGSVLAFAVADSVKKAAEEIIVQEAEIKKQLKEVEAQAQSLPEIRVEEESKPSTPAVIRILDVANKSNRIVPESLTNTERVKKLLAFFAVSKIGRAAVLAAAVAFPSATGNDGNIFKAPDIIASPTTPDITSANAATTLDKQAIKNYLQTFVKSSVDVARGYATNLPPVSTEYEPIMFPSQFVGSEDVDVPTVNSGEVILPGITPTLVQPQGADVRPFIEDVPAYITSYEPTTFKNQFAASEKVDVFTTAPEEIILSGPAPVLMQPQGADARPFIEDVQAYPDQETVKSPDIMHKITKGDIFWNIAEGETAVDLTQAMKEIHPEFRQRVIDIARDRINKNPELRTLIGGFDNSKDIPANYLVIGESMNVTELNLLLSKIAKECGYL